MASLNVYVTPPSCLEIESLQGMPSVTVTRVDGNSCWIEMAVDKGYYQSATLGFCIDFPATYPLEAPTVHTVGRIYHPNISYDQGQIHLAILKHWAPSLHLYHVVQAIENMLLVNVFFVQLLSFVNSISNSIPMLS